MTGYNFLYDSPPEIVDAVRTLRVPRRLHSLAAAWLTFALVFVAAAGIENARVHDALSAQEQARERFDESRAALAQANVATKRLDDLLAQDRRLRSIRSSGPMMAARLAAIGNLFPRHAWLSAMTVSGQGYRLHGNAVDLPSIATLVGNLIADHRAGAPTTVALTSVDRTKKLLAFDLGTSDAQ